MLPTPSTSHVNYDYIYEPAEDSYLFLDTLSAASESDFLHERFASHTTTPLVVEVGTGSGVILAFVYANAEHIFGRTDILTLGVDINAQACVAARETIGLAGEEAKSDGKCPGLFLGCLNTDLSAPIKPFCVDVLIFNPPYVPTESVPHAVGGSDAAQDLLAFSYAGGVDGMEVTDRLLAQLPSLLSARGVAYVLLCAQNKPRTVVERIQSWPGGWSAELVATSGKTAGWEKLCILRICRN